MIVDSALYRDGVRVDAGDGKDDLESLHRAVLEEGDFVWVGLHEPSHEELQRVADLFGLHQLAVEDSLHDHQRPKLERYGDNLFLVLKTLWYEESTDAVETGQVTVFIGNRFAVSVRVGEGIELATARHELEERAATLGHGPSAVAHAICDRVVDGYEAVVESLAEDVDEVEESVFSPQRSEDAKRIYILKREIAEVRRAVLPLRGPMELFATGALEELPAASVPFFRDVADHVARVGDMAESLDNLLSTAFQAHLARISVQQNEDMRKISAWVAIAAVGTLIAGVYGMNFDHMPELGWRFGYFSALGLMLLISAGLYRLFKKSGWL